jgi:hypothetical protein
MSPSKEEATVATAVPVVAAQPVAQPVKTITKKVPPGYGPGDTLVVDTAAGPMQVVIPEGMDVGMEFVVQLPAGGGPASAPVGYSREERGAQDRRDRREVPPPT